MINEISKYPYPIQLQGYKFPQKKREKIDRNN